MADDDLDEELLYVTGRGSKAAASKKRRKADDWEEDDDGDEGGAAAGAGGGAGGSSKRGKASAAYSDEDDDMDDEERAKLEGMNELDREMYLFEREEKLQRQRERQQVLAATKGKDEVRASRTRPRQQTGADTALDRLAAAHAQRQERQKRKQQEQRQTARGRSQRQYADEDDEPDDDEEPDDDGDGSYDASGGGGRDSEDGMAGLEEEGDDGGGGARAEVYDEGGGYEEADEPASLEDLRTIQLKRSQLEAWHNEPFFEDDVKGCLVRIVAPPQPGSSRPAPAAPQYLVVRVADVVQRNSYSFPKPPHRTRKWLHLDDLTGSGVFRQQMGLVSNGDISEAEYDKLRARATRGGRQVTKGDVAAAGERLQHARTFKYDSQLVKEMLARKRAAGKISGKYAEVRTRLADELLKAQDSGRPEEEVQKIKDDLEHLERQEQRRKQEEAAALAQALEGDNPAASAAAAATGSGRLKGSMALALVNLRNKNKNDFKAINAAPGSALARATAPSGGAMNDVFSRRHTKSKVYWNTKRGAGGPDGAGGGPDGAAPAGLQRSASSAAADVAALSGNLKQLDPAELIKVLDLSLDLSRLPPPNPTAQLPKRLLGQRWFDSVAQRQAHMADWHVLSLEDYQARQARAGLAASGGGGGGPQQQ